MACTISREEITRVKGLGFLNNKGTDFFNGRVITGNGKITSKQMMDIAKAAEKFGNGEVVFTTRLTVEIREVHFDHIEPMREYLAKAGLTTGGTGAKVRPVVSCKGTTCQYGLLDSYGLAKEIHERFYIGYRSVVLPHKFKIAVGGCPNNCVKPDLNDVGIVGQRIPGFDAEACKGCKKCAIEKACPVGAAKVEDGKMVRDPAICNNCGRCIGKCPFKASEDGTYGYKIYIGGRWGKKVAQGRALGKVFTDKEEMLSVVEKVILLFREQGVAGERLSQTIDRIGFENVEAQLLSDEILTRKETILATE